MVDDANLSVRSLGPGGREAEPPPGAIVVAPSAGDLARRVGTMLLRAGRDVTLVHPDPSVVGALVDRGAHLICGHPEVPGILRAALAHASGLVWIPRTNALGGRSQLALQTSDLAAAACARARVGHVAVLSVLGDPIRLRGTPVGVLQQIERPFLERCTSVSVIRAGLFMDHLAALAPGAAAYGTLRLPFPPDLPLPWVAIEDVAHELVRHVLDRPRGADVVALRGPELTAAEVTQTISESIWTPALYAQLEPHELAGYLESQRVRRPKARWLAALWTAAASGAMSRSDEQERNTPTETSIDAWASGAMWRAVRRERRFPG